MLDAIFGSRSAERVLLYMQNYGEAYAQGIATTFKMSSSQSWKQLQKFEQAGLLVSRLIGKSRVYTWNKGNPVVKALREFLQTILQGLPENEQQAYYRQRKRPRLTGKPS